MQISPGTLGLFLNPTNESDYLNKTITHALRLSWTDSLGYLYTIVMLLSVRLTTHLRVLNEFDK